mmetsp:Transcript_2428/g.5198  ORF Transcript_2428/g.5198 Transcript_2428/m.5198 type:complete len:240 (-) Transcript_2428:114-833(-)|eukprot:CAMPEP_0178428792 /NCGR_PEP_ID=MMETSP0689_2-20121128/30466_1 /TAXON_ID=160604 /ORGANISM="Amphidinium massartii, Strain CS-259" /LENGTH=239 /DNA_ID=CAMNT_0020050587 /DNA_START=89 /DNA_END=808 /DNA_ORIENTATION=-
MGFSFKSDGLVISPAGELKLPLAAVGESVLEVQWSTEGDLEVDFSITFTPEGGEEKELQPAERLSSRQSTVPIEGPGSCVLFWNNCYAGWLGGSARKLSYALTMKTQAEIEEEERLKAEAEEAERKRLEQLAEEERRQKAEEEARIRREARESRITELRTAAEEKQAEVEDHYSSVLEGKTLVERLTSELEAATLELASLQTKMETLHGEASVINEELEKLIAERLQDVPSDGQPDEQL